MLSDNLKLCNFSNPKEILDDESKEIELLWLQILSDFFIVIKKSYTNQDPNPNFQGWEGLTKTSKEQEGEKTLWQSRA